MGFPTQEMTAPCHPRYVGKFYWCDYWRQWDKVLGVNCIHWTVQRVDGDGEPLDPPREHCTPLHANRFADRPFEVRSSDLR